MRTGCTLRALSLASTLLLCAVSADAEPWITYYDVDFSSPFHTVGEPPTNDDGPLPRQGSPSGPPDFFPPLPTVVEGYGALEDQPVLFEVTDDENETATYEQLDFDPPGTWLSMDRFVIEFDLLVDGLGGFSVFVDGPSIHRLSWESDGHVHVATALGNPPPLPEDDLGPYVPGEPMAVRIEYDPEGLFRPVGEWRVYFDGALVHQHVTRGHVLYDFRLSLNRNYDTVAAVDNVRISALPKLPAVVDVLPWSDENEIPLRGRRPIVAALLANPPFTTDDILTETLGLGPERVPPLGRVWRTDLNDDGFDDLLARFPREGSGIGDGATELCITGLYDDPGPLPGYWGFGGCDAIQVVPRCGRGYELAAVVPPLLWLGRRRRRPHSGRSAP